MVLKRDPAMYFLTYFSRESNHNNLIRNKRPDILYHPSGGFGDYMVFTGGRSGGQSSPTAYKEWTLENCE